VLAQEEEGLKIVNEAMAGEWHLSSILLILDSRLAIPYSCLIHIQS
jgi:hypothetical protein